MEIIFPGFAECGGGGRPSYAISPGHSLTLRHLCTCLSTVRLYSIASTMPAPPFGTASAYTDSFPAPPPKQVTVTAETCFNLGVFRG